MSERIGSDKRWQEYAKTRQDPYKEIVLPHIRCDFRLTFSPDHHKALCGDFELLTYLIDMNNANVLATLDVNNLGSTSIKSIQCTDFSPDGKRAISAGGTYHTDRSFLDRVRGKPIKRDWALYFWDLSTGKEIGQVKGQNDYIRAVAYSPVSEKALSGGAQGDILLWNLDNMQVLKRFVGHSGVRRGCLTWAQDGKRFLSGGWDGSVRLWDVETGRELAHLQPVYGRVMSLALSPDGKYALSSYLDGPDQPVIYWDLDAQKEINRFGVPGNPWFADQGLNVESVAFSPDGKTALFGLYFGTVIWWDLNEWKAIAMNRLYEREVVFVGFSLDGKSSISAGNDSDTDRRAKVRFWQLPIRPDTPIGSGESSPLGKQPPNKTSVPRLPDTLSRTYATQ